MMKKQQGLTMIEILVAMLILAIGLLGMASLQVRSVQDTGNSNLRSVAIYIANDMADRIRANSTAMSEGDYDNTDNAAFTNNCITTTGCTSTQMANHDMHQWLENVSNTLPSGDGTIERDGDLFEINVSWNERVVRQEDEDGNETSMVRGSVTLTFEP